MTPIPDSAPLLSIAGAIATIRLNRPSCANRIEHGDLDVLLQHAKSIAANPDIRAVILTGTGKHFSSGYDLTSILSTVEEDPTASTAANPFGPMVDAFEAIPQPVICALNGGIYGGATDLALACDLRLGVPHTKMFMPAAKLGLHYYLSGMKRYVSRLGFNTAKRLFLFAENMDAEQMLQTGFLDRIVPAESLEDEAQKSAQVAANMAPLAIHGMKQALNQLAQDALDVDLFSGNETACLRSQDIQEGVTAWHEKRPARFKGR
ncbi:3-hydroxybutyryl-CoA dehydratase [Pusillimonas sp. T7-7]|uniref:enoyl-CoA hydratase/isomerase family protein n=1 Tax=Pusillimonas sp. (strain T7-7) TaxID=1007105 RepID=UPI0002084E4F|nr:enoyl-CoA hydratase/isomerase family protein [Pusillimonas sp. T7-7]AEC21785.1 3-hydroxybutyryl-CoA dehydratase [Pusillimonas sp. T7-7]